MLRDDPEFAPEIERWSTYIGQGAIRFYLPLDVQLANPFFAQAVIVSKDIEARERLQPRLETLLAERFPQVVGRVSPLELGPPVGWPVQYRVLGPDPTQLRDIAMKLGDLVAANPGTRRVNFDWMEPERELHIRVDQEQARQLGLSSQAVSTALNANITGSAITQVRDDIYLVNVVAREVGGQSLSVETLRNLPVSLPNGRTIPLSQFATFEYGQDYPLVWRRDRVPTLTVQADVAPGAMPETVVADLTAPIAELNATLPAGYRIELGGSVEESAASSASVFAVVPLMLLLMLTLLIFQLKSFARLFIVLSLVPLGLIGVVAALLVSGKPLGFVAILGILALIGMIAKNAVILIDQIESRTGRGQDGLGRRGGGQRVALPAHHADRALDGARHDPHRAHGLLGLHGLRHHGRSAGRLPAHPGLSPDPLCHMVWGQGAGCRWESTGRQCPCRLTPCGIAKDTHASPWAQPSSGRCSRGAPAPARSRRRRTRSRSRPSTNSPATSTPAATWAIRGCSRRSDAPGRSMRARRSALG